jgi:hypothetical protein
MNGRMTRLVSWVESHGMSTVDLLPDDDDQPDLGPSPVAGYRVRRWQKLTSTGTDSVK